MSSVSDFGADGMNTEYIHTGKNLGYGRAHNIALRRAIAAGGRYHIVLNPDISFDAGIVDTMAEYMDAHQDVVEMMPKVLNPDGTIQYLCKLLPTPFDLILRRFFPQIGIIKKRNDRYTLKASGYDRIMDVPCLSGCFMFLRLAALAAHGILFDERFFMYCEDFDLIRRLQTAGRTLYFPHSAIVHCHARGSYRHPRMLLWHIASAVRYFSKWGWR
jgi:GT2 family glycosyltransferase